MKFNNIKLKKLKFLFIKNENKRLALNYIQHNKKLPSIIRWKASLILSKYKLSSKTKLASRCYLTLRSRSYSKLFALSRIKVRDLAREGKLPFLNKASW